MAQKQKNEIQKAYLTIDKVKLREAITQKIEDGNELLSRSILARTQYVNSRLTRVYDKTELDNFRNEKSIWVNTTAEILKQAFDIPNNEYHKEFVNVCNIIGVYTSDTDWLAEYKGEISEGITNLNAFLQKIEWIPISPFIQSKPTISSKTSLLNKNIFIVHGHDEKVRSDVESFVRTIGYNPIILSKEANKGQTIIEKIESNSENICYAIILYTACDEGRTKGADTLKPRARQNVVFEHGYMCAKLGRSRVTALLESEVEQPGDLSGVIYIQLDNAGAWKLKITREMKSIGLEVDANALL